MSNFLEKHPRISVMMPVRNCERFIVEAVNSVLGQTCRDFELLIWNDASTDATLVEAMRLADRDLRIKVFSSFEQQGLSRTRNLILNRAQGELLCHVDGDDSIAPEALATMVSAFDADPALLLGYSDMHLMDSNGKVGGVHLAKDFSRENLAYLGWRHLGMYKTAVARELGGFNERLLTCEDGDLFMRIALTGKCRRIPLPLYYYRSHATNIGRTKKKCEECDRLPYCNYFRIWSEAKQEWLARQKTLSASSSETPTRGPSRVERRVPVVTLGDWNVCVNRITPLLKPAISQVEATLNGMKSSDTDQVSSIIRSSLFSYVDTFDGVEEGGIPSGLNVFRLMDRAFTNPLADKLLLGREVNRLNLVQWVPRSYETVDAALEGTRSSGATLVFIKGRCGTAGEQVQCLRTTDLVTTSLPHDYVIQEAVENVALHEGRKVVFRFYVLIHSGKIFLSTHAFAVVHGEAYDANSTDYDVQIRHAGYNTADSKVKLIALTEFPRGKDWLAAIQVLTGYMKPLLEPLRRECPPARYALLGIDGVPCSDGCVRMIEINNFPNMIHTKAINESVNIPMIASVMLKIVTNTSDASLVEIW